MPDYSFGQTTLSQRGQVPQRNGPNPRDVFPTQTIGLPALILCLVSWALALGLTSASAQVSPDQAADVLLNSARRAYNEKNYPFAATRFKEFLDRFGGHKEAPSARYGLALALLEGPERDYPRIHETLQPLAGNKDFPDHPFVLYYLGLAQRGLGLRELAQADGRPQELPQRRAAAQGRFEEAGRQFAAAAAALAGRVKPVPAGAKELPQELEWLARARCDQAEMELRTLKLREAQATTIPFVKDPVQVKSRYRTLGLYYHGYASFLLKDYQTAGRALTVPALHADPVFGTHARYLLARLYHLSEERAEAALHYQGVLDDYAKHKKAAEEALRQPDRFRNDPEERSRLETLVQARPPEHVSRAACYLGVLLYEGGKFAEAQAHFSNFAQQNPGTPLAAEATLRLGFCQVQQRQFTEAIRTLQPLADREPNLADQALLWLAKAQAALADPAKPPEAEQAFRNAMDTLRRAAEKAQQLTATDPEAKTRRAEILLEMADTQLLARQFREAFNTYNQVLNEKNLPAREEEIVQRQATAMQLAGDFAESDKICTRFQENYPKSSLLATVFFRKAENAYFQVLAAEKNPNLPDRQATLAKMNDEVITRYALVVEKFPEGALINLARYGLALGHYRKGNLEKALETLKTIPQAECTGELSLVPYLQADCLIRLAPVKADDAIAAGQAQEQLKSAGEFLESFIGNQPNGPQAPDALLKLGHCQQRMASLLAQKEEKARLLGSARAAYDKLINQFPQSHVQPAAILERAKCQAQAGDLNGAMNELRRFSNDPLRSAPVAPMALLQLATYLRAQNKPAEAADLLGQCRQQQEENLRRDPARAGWVALLQYHHGLALKEAGKGDEARKVLDLVLKQSAERPEAAEAALRWGQSLREEGLQKIAEARKKLATANLKAEEITTANQALDQGLRTLREAVQFLEGQAEQLKARQPPVEIRARLLYEAAWACRPLAEAEIAAARTKVQQALWQKLADEVARKTPPGQKPIPVPLPEVPLSQVPVQPAEQKTREYYQTLISAFADLPWIVDVRLELAELLGERSEHDAAIRLLREALDKEPAAELGEKLRLRLGVCLAAKGDHKGALAHFLGVAGNAKSPWAAQAYYRAGECLLAQGQGAEAVKHLSLFRDRGEFQNLPGLTDRALLRLGQALGQLKQWEPSRQAHEQVVNRFGNSPWIHEARYGMGWAWQNQQQYDNAVNAYTQVTANTLTETAAKAQLQIGLCRLEQKRYSEAATALLVVPFSYDYPEWNAAALCEAARSFTELKQTEQAVRLLERVLRDHGNTPWAETAKQRLGALKKGP